MVNDIRSMRCYANQKDEFPIISLYQNGPSPGFLYLVCGNASTRHINKIAIQAGNASPYDFDYSAEVTVIGRLDNKYSQMLANYPTYLLNNYVSVKNSYMISSKIEMAAGIRFIIEQFAYKFIAKGSTISHDAMRSIGVERAIKLTINPDSNPSNLIPEREIISWAFRLKQNSMLPEPEVIQKMIDAYNVTSDELHDGLKTSKDMVDALENSMDLLLEFYNLGNRWSD